MSGKFGYNSNNKSSYKRDYKKTNPYVQDNSEDEQECLVIRLETELDGTSQDLVLIPCGEVEGRTIWVEGTINPSLIKGSSRVEELRTEESQGTRGTRV